MCGRRAPTRRRAACPPDRPRGPHGPDALVLQWRLPPAPTRIRVQHPPSHHPGQALHKAHVQRPGSIRARRRLWRARARCVPPFSAPAAACCGANPPAPGAATWSWRKLFQGRSGFTWSALAMASLFDSAVRLPTQSAFGLLISLDERNMCVLSLLPLMHPGMTPLSAAAPPQGGPLQCPRPGAGARAPPRILRRCSGPRWRGGGQRHVDRLRLPPAQ